MANHGVAYQDRWKVLRERVLAMRAIWSEDAPEFHGQHVDFDPIWSYPKPHRPGGPPILLGASSRWTWERIAEYGDGWFPIHQDPKRAQQQGAVDYVAGIAATRAAWQRAERVGQPSFNIFGVPANPQRVAELIDMGFDRLIFGLPSADADTVMPLLDRLADLAFRQHG
jgi:alkanesulfonate monooxygenase SsuD/methylene tetrahydromethanopterin reductase-like flavin-dependent oxidoreductase (luciferase family)